MTALPAKSVAAARTTLSRIMTSADVNLYGTVHGGVVMKLVDDLGGAVAARHSGGPVVTAAMDEMQFLVPVRVGDLVHAHGQVNWTGRSSMEVGVRVMAERWDDATIPPTHVASAYLVFVAVDGEGSPRPVPQVECEDELDRRRWREAEIRRLNRLARREAILRSREQGEPPTPSGTTGTGGAPAALSTSAGRAQAGRAQAGTAHAGTGRTDGRA